MKQTCRIYQVDAFTRTRFTGNPAGVVPNADGLDERQMQAIARELNNSETAFIFEPEGADHDVRIRFFTPTAEVPVCGHATIAAHHVRWLEGRHGNGPTRQLTGAGIQQIEIEPAEGGIWMHQNRPSFGSVLVEEEQRELLAALRISVEMLGRGPIQIVSTGHSKVMVPLRDRRVLGDLAPDQQALATLSRRIGCNGYHLFTLADPDPGILAHARMFAPAIGIAEDPVTGNGNGPLGAYLVQHRLVALGEGELLLRGQMRQGETMGRPGEMTVEVRGERNTHVPREVRIRGDAVVVFQAEMRL